MLLTLHRSMGKGGKADKHARPNGSYSMLFTSFQLNDHTSREKLNSKTLIVIEI